MKKLKFLVMVLACCFMALPCGTVFAGGEDNYVCATDVRCWDDADCSSDQDPSGNGSKGQCDMAGAFCEIPTGDGRGVCVYGNESCVEEIDCSSAGYWAMYPSNSTLEFRNCQKINEDCSREQVAEYRCASGYYGYNSPSASDVCTQCPNHYATCSGTGFTCSQGYYKDGSSCSTCPNANSTYTSSTLTSGNLAHGVTSAAGATSLAECYVSNGTYYDAKGTKTISVTGSNGCSYSSNGSSVL